MLTGVALRVFIALRGIGTRIDGDDGQTLAEYSLIITTIAVAVTILSVVVFRNALAAAFNSVIPCLTGSC